MSASLETYPMNREPEDAPLFDDGMSAMPPLRYDATGKEYVLMGGGTGMSAVSQGAIERLAGAQITIGVGTGDSGGGTGKDRQEYGTVAMGDGRSVIAALSPYGKQFDYKFDASATLESAKLQLDMVHDNIKNNGYESRLTTERTLRGVRDEILPEVARRGLVGRNLGNLIMVRMQQEDVFTDAGDVFLRTGRLLDIPENVTVMPTSVDRHHLYARDNGRYMATEGFIDEQEIEDPDNAEVWVQQEDGYGPVRMYQPFESALKSADGVIVGPGSYFTTHGANGALWGMDRVMQSNKDNGGVLISVANLAESHDSRDFNLLRHSKLIGRLMHREMDCVVINDAVLDIPADAKPIMYDSELAAKLDSKVVPVTMYAGPTEKRAGDLVATRSKVATDGAAVIDGLVRDGVLDLKAISHLRAV